jgi:hypothetical protein
MQDRDIERVIAELLQQRGFEKSICPSEVARVLAGEQELRVLMELVREVALKLARSGVIEITQRGRPVDLNGYRGPIRLRLPRSSG